MEMLQEKRVNYDDDVNMTIRIIKDDPRFVEAGDRARQWLLHYFTYQRQVTYLPYLRAVFISFNPFIASWSKLLLF